MITWKIKPGTSNKFYEVTKVGICNSNDIDFETIDSFDINWFQPVNYEEELVFSCNVDNTLDVKSILLSADSIFAIIILDYTIPSNSIIGNFILKFNISIETESVVIELLTEDLGTHIYEQITHLDIYDKYYRSPASLLDIPLTQKTIVNNIYAYSQGGNLISDFKLSNTSIDRKRTINVNYTFSPVLNPNSKLKLYAGNNTIYLVRFDVNSMIIINLFTGLPIFTKTFSENIIDASIKYVKLSLSVYDISDDVYIPYSPTLVNPIIDSYNGEIYFDFTKTVVYKYDRTFVFNNLEVKSPWNSSKLNLSSINIEFFNERVILCNNKLYCIDTLNFIEINLTEVLYYIRTSKSKRLSNFTYDKLLTCQGVIFLITNKIINW